MKRFPPFLRVLLLTIAASLPHAGCEVESASKNSVSISPGSTSIRKEGRIEFTASGGFEYAWSLSEPAWGTLSARRGSRTVYTSAYAPPSVTGDTAYVQVLTVVSTIEPGADTGGTNSAAYQHSAEATIQHLPDEPKAAAGLRWSPIRWPASRGRAFVASLRAGLAARGACPTRE